MEVDPQTDEVYVADGYLNRRVIVFDAETGEYKRHWGAYGNEPEDFAPGIYYDGGRYMKTGPDGEPIDPGLFPPIAPGRRAPGSETTYNPNDPPPQQFNIVHALRVTKDGLVYVADRTNNRIQVFQRDGTFVKEVIIAKKTRSDGSTWDVDVSPDEKQTFLYVADGINQVVWILRREDLEIVGSFGRRGHGAGEFHWLHRLAVDSQGNIYTGEVSRGRRLQKWGSGRRSGDRVDRQSGLSLPFTRPRVSHLILLTLRRQHPGMIWSFLRSLHLCIQNAPLAGSRESRPTTAARRPPSLCKTAATLGSGSGFLGTLAQNLDGLD